MSNFVKRSKRGRLKEVEIDERVSNAPHRMKRRAAVVVIGRLRATVFPARASVCLLSYLHRHSSIEKADCLV